MWAMEELQLRDYQMSCLEKAKHQNVLLVLPPQMGKTFIACQLAEWYRGQDQLVAYTAPNVELCHQAARCFRQLPQAAVATVTGECRWEKEEWKKGCNGNDVIIATPECFRQALQSAWLNPCDIALFIFDECHHATGKSPMGIILKEHLHPSSHPPRLLALTSCPTSSTSRKRGRAAGHAELAELEEIFRAELCWPKVANDAEEMIESPLQRKSWEKVHWDVDDYDASAVIELLQRHWQSLSHVLGIGSQARDFRTIVDRMQKVLQQLGRDALLHYMDHCCATQIREALDKNLKFEEKDKERALCDNMDMVEHRLKELVPLVKESAQNLPRVSGKALMLHHLLEGLETAKAVIFVKDAAVTMPLAQGIVENVGVMAEAYYAQRRDCAKILDDFRSGTVQVLVSTVALEEGLVLDCSWVVRFDHFTSTRSHVAGSGRGSSRIFYFCNDPSDEIRRASELNDATARAELRGKRQRLDVHVPEVRLAGATGAPISPFSLEAKHYECQADEKVMEIEQLELPGAQRLQQPATAIKRRSRERSRKKNTNFKNLLQERVQKLHPRTPIKELVKYSSQQATGQVDWLAAVEVQAAGMKLTQQGGPCRSRKEAEQEAAERALERLLMAVDGHAGC